MKNETKKAFKNFIKENNFKYLKKSKILPYIDYEFSFYHNDDETIATYVLDIESESIHPLIDATRTCSLTKSTIKILLFIPSSCNMPADIKTKIYNTQIEIYVVNEGIAESYIKASEIKMQEKSRLKNLMTIINSINIASTNYLGLKLFKIDKKLFNKFKITIDDEEGFIYQIQTIVSIIESLEYSKIRAGLPKLKKNESTFIEKKQSISVIELIFKKNKRPIDAKFQRAIRELRNLRDLRNMPPAHPSSTYKKVCKIYIGKKIPKTKTDWKRLSQVALSRFEESLKDLKECILRK